MPHLRKQLPKYCLHKKSGRAFVRIGGKMYYLGKHGSTASRREYDRLIAEFIANARQPFHSPDEILIESLIVRFLDCMRKERNYREDAKKRMQRILRLFNDLYEPPKCLTLWLYYNRTAAVAAKWSCTVQSQIITVELGPFQTILDLFSNLCHNPEFCLFYQNLIP